MKVYVYYNRAELNTTVAYSTGDHLVTLKGIRKVAIIAMYCHLRQPNAIAFPV